MLTVFTKHLSIPYFVADTRQDLGLRAAADIATELHRCLEKQENVRMIFAAAPSQSEMLAVLVTTPDIDWRRVTAFHMDEYLGLSPQAPQRFASWLDRHLFHRISLGAVYRIEADTDPEKSADSYAAALAEAPIDIVCCGIGTNGHLAFNDPPADFQDSKSVKIVALDAICRQQQVDDLCFHSLEEVPTHAITLTVPRLLASGSIFCCVPGAAKRAAVHLALTGPLSEDCPASALRLHPDCKLYLDRDSACDLPEEQKSMAIR